MNLYNAFENLIRVVKAKNAANKDVKTAEPSVFEEVQKKVENLEAEPSRPKTRADIIKEYRDKVREAQIENEADPQVETAHTSVYDDLMEELEVLREQQGQETRAEVYQQGSTHEPIREFDPVETQAPVYSQPSSQSLVGAQALTNSAGSLALREFPRIDAQQSKVRVPNKTLLKIIQVSEKSINLDSKKSRFILVEHGGQRGWILESYLNFN